MTTFVTVGNALQSFARLFECVAQASPSLPQPVVAQVGSTPFHDTRFDCVRFLDGDQFERMLDRAVLVICHGGAGSLIASRRAGHCPIVMPRLRRYGEHVDDHQVDLVGEYAARGFCLPARGAGEIADHVPEALSRRSQRKARIDCPDWLDRALREAAKAKVRRWPGAPY